MLKKKKKKKFLKRGENLLKLGFLLNISKKKKISKKRRKKLHGRFFKSMGKGNEWRTMES
jgi:hypothetical protein